MEENEFLINVFSLKVGEHRLSYHITGEFVEFFYPGLVEDASVKVDVILKKSETMVELVCYSKGTVELLCDRSLEAFTEPIDKEDRLFLKFGDEAQELSEEIIIIPYHQHEVDLSQFVYEFIALAVPMKKLHPKFREESADEEEVSGEILIYSSSEEQNDEESSEPVDPRWEALKHINKN